MRRQSRPARPRPALLGGQSSRQQLQGTQLETQASRLGARGKKTQARGSPPSSAKRSASRASLFAASLGKICCRRKARDSSRKAFFAKGKSSGCACEFICFGTSPSLLCDCSKKARQRPFSACGSSRKPCAPLSALCGRSKESHDRRFLLDHRAPITRQRGSALCPSSKNTRQRSFAAGISPVAAGISPEKLCGQRCALCSSSSAGVGPANA